MTTLGNRGPNPPNPATAAPLAVPAGLPRVDMASSAEMQAWLARLQVEDHKIGARNKYLTGALAAGVLLLLTVLWIVYRATVGAYAEIDGIRIEQHPINEGRLQITFRALSPGKVYCRRTSGNVETDVIDYFYAPAEVDRPWSWAYRPGASIDVTLWHRRGLFRRTFTQSFATAGRADVVILIDTTGSMDPSIAELQDKCVIYSEQLRRQALRHRFALLGFGDVREDPWLDRHGFTDDVSLFQQAVADVKRFDGGDLPESALDALEVAMALPFDERAIRRFYLVTDADYHEPTRSGAAAAELAARLAKQRVQLRVFSRPEFEPRYARLLGETGRFEEIENFGKVLSQGRVLED